MNIENLILEIKNSVSKRLGKEYSVTTREIIKNNNVKLHGITISDSNVNISPTIYMDDFFTEYQRGVSLDDITNEILRIYSNSKQQVSFDVESFTDFNKVKGKIFYSLINTGRNEELLKDIPSVPFLDLSIVFKVLVSTNGSQNASVLIHNSHLDMWNVTVNELYSIAHENASKLLPAEIRDILDVIRELAPRFCPTDAADNTLYVMTNDKKLFGSSCILYPNVIEQFAEKIKRDLYILPSSTHEVLLAPVNFDNNPLELANMVRIVNQTEVDPEDILSDNVYLFSRQSKQIVIANV